MTGLASMAGFAFVSGPARAAGSGSLDAAGTTIVAFSDTHQPSTVTAAPFVMTMLRQWYCSKPDRGGPLSLNSALTVAKTLVAADSRGKGLQAFARSRDGRNESTAMAAAAGALGIGKPAAALAALLRANQLAPRDPVPLIDAAPLLTQAGKGRAALALLDAAGRLKAPKSNPFGISWSAMMTANRGEALIITGQYAQAQKTLAAALKAAPLLREARQNMAVAYTCQGNTTQAKRYLFAAVRRQTFKSTSFVTQPPPPPPPKQPPNQPPDQSGQLDPALVLDTTKGQALTLQALHFPLTLAEGAALRPWYQSLSNTLVAQLSSLVSQSYSDRLRLNKWLQRANPATRQRTEEILSAAGGGAGEPAIAALQRQAAVFVGQMSALQSQGLGGATRYACLNPSLHGQWLAALVSYDHAQRRSAIAQYRLETALTANLANPLAHQVAIDDARQHALSNFILIVGAAQGLANYDAICLPPKTNPGPGSNPASGQTQTPSSRPCPTWITGADFSLELSVFALEIHCEEATVRSTTGGWAAAFISLTHNFKNGENTIFAGGQVGQKYTIGPLTGGATARAGIYLTVRADGTLKDVGGRATSSLGLSVGYQGVGAKGSIKGPELKFSFVGALSSPI